jgi:lactate dehydrogenase-like 2-hydroxyacid dehydrogenase
MTNLEALKANISSSHGIVLEPNAYLKALADESLNEMALYVKDTEQSIDMATVRLLKTVLATANVGEGGLNYSQMNKEYIEKTIDNLLVKWGLDTEFKKVPQITGIKPW